MPQYNVRKGSMQDRFFASRNKIQIYAGGFGNGKTSAACIKGMHLAWIYPGSNGLIARSTYPKLNDTIRKEFFKWLPEDEVKRLPTKDDNTLHLVNGTTINFRYIDQRGKMLGQDTTSNLLSATYDWIVIDQMEDPEIGYKDFIDLLGRLRGATPRDPTFTPQIPSLAEDWPRTGPRTMIITLNPTRNWIYKKIVRPTQVFLTKGIKTDELIVNERTGQCLVDIVEGSTYENAENLEEDFIETLEATYKGQMKKRFLQGQWAAYEGPVYPDFDELTHVLRHREIEEYYRSMWELGICVREGYDFGIVVPSCYLYGFTDVFNNIFIMDGYYEPGEDEVSQANRIKAIRHRYSWDLFNRSPVFADPDVFTRKGVGVRGKTVGQRFADQDIDMQRADNAINSGILRVSGYMSPNKFHKHPIYATYDAPRLYVSDELQFFVDEILDYYWKRDTSNDVTEKPQDKNDHAMDALKYLTTDMDSLTIVDRVKVRSGTNVPMTWREYELSNEQDRSSRYG